MLGANKRKYTTNRRTRNIITMGSQATKYEAVKIRLNSINAHLYTFSRKMLLMKMS